MRSSSASRRIRRYRSAIAEARHSGVDPDELFEARERERSSAYERSLEGQELSRRAFLRRGAAFGIALAGAGALTSGPFARLADAAAPRIAIVGGGLAGTTAAYRINRRKGWLPTIYEAQDRIGGRTRTIHGLSGGQYAEAGGGGISTRDNEIRALAEEVGLWPLVDTWDHYPGGDEAYYVNGQRRPWSAFSQQIKENANAQWKAWVSMGKQIPTYRNANAKMRTYDRMSVTEFLNQECPNGTDTLGGELSAILFGVDYAGRPSESSAIHFILDEAGIWGGGGWDERYAIPGGNEELSQALASALPFGDIKLGHALLAIRTKPNGTVILTFDDGGSLVEVVADHVVLALPPTAVADVDFSGAGFGKVKRREIRREKLGPNAKYNLQFDNSPWGGDGDSGDGATDTTLGQFWQANFLSASPSVLMGMNNEDYGPSTPAHGAAPTAIKNQLIADINTLWPGAGSHLINGQAYLDYWPNDPWARGSYSYYPPGGFTGFGGVQREPRGRIHFAGEHTADYIERGFMNGAVASGERAAREVTG